MIHTFFDAANIALKQFSESKSRIKSQRANDGNFDTCFIATQKDPWWSLELGANVRVSLVFILEFKHGLRGVDILVGECVLAKASYNFCLSLICMGSKLL